MATYQESTGGTLPFYNDAIQELLKQGQAQLTASKTGTAPLQQVAGLNPLQQQAMQLAQSQVGGYRPMTTQAQSLLGAAPVTSADVLGLAPAMQSGTLGANYAAMLGAGAPQYDTAQQALTGAMGTNLAGVGADLYGQAQTLYGGSGAYDPAAIQQYLNPYIGGVVNEIGRLGAEQLANVINPALSSTFGGLGQQGSARQAAMLADAAARSQREVLGQQANALSGAYGQASQDYLNWANRQAAAAAGLVGLGQQQYAQQLGQSQLGMSGAQQLANLGQQQFTQQAAASQLQEQGWQNALANALSGGQLQYQSALGAGGALGNLAQAVQQMGLSDVGTLTAAGQLGQQQQQAQLTAQYQNQLAQQQYPWQQLGNYAQLFGAGTPQASSSWQTSFKKGGLARYADGGRFQGPDLIEGQLQQLLAPSTGSPNYVDQALGARQQFLSRAQSSPAFADAPEPSFGEAAGQAMMRAAAAGPANLGQMLGRAGTEYFGAEQERREKNREAALNRLLLEQKALPPIIPGAVRSGSGPSAEQMRSVYTSARNEAAQIAKDYQFDSAEDRSAWIEQQANEAVRNYLEKWATRPLGPRGGEFSALGTRPLEEAPKAALEEPRVRFTSPDGSTASLNMKGTPESVQRELESLAEPNRTEALRALAASQGRPEPEGVPSPPPRDKRAEQYKSAYGGEEGKALFKERENLNTLYATNAGMVNQLNMLENLYSNPNLPEGELGPILQRIRSGMQSVGIDVGDSTGPADLANAIAQKMVLAQRTSDGTNLLPGAISNFEVQLLQSMGPTLSLTQEGRQALVRFMKELAVTNQRIAQEGTQFASQNNDMLTPGWYQRKERVMLEEMARLKMLSNQVMGQFKGSQK